MPHRSGALMDSNDNSFWKPTSRAVPGRPSPKKLVTGVGAGGIKHLQQSAGGAVGAGGMTSTFQDFQQSCSDAWDMGDDEFCILSNEMKDARISKRASQSAALNVIQIHRNNSVKVDGGTAKTPSSSAPLKNTTALNTHRNESLKSNTQVAGVHQHPSMPPSTQRSQPPPQPSQHNEHANATTVAVAPAAGDDNPIATNDTMHTSDARPPAFRASSHFPGRPQLIRLSSSALCGSGAGSAADESKVDKFTALLEAALLNQLALKELSFSGVPSRCRPVTWRLLSGYLPTSHERRAAVLERKRLDYQALLAQYFHSRDRRDEAQQETFQQIHIDMPRMNPQVPLFQQRLVQEMFERVLFVWAIRHPASGYVQGINDLVTPFFIVFLQEALDGATALDTFTFAQLSVEQRNVIEADAFWCLTKFMDCIQDNYIFAQLGIQAKVNQLKELIQRIDAPLHRHLQQHGVDYLQFSFRWMNNLLTRELPLHCTIRLWDTYLAESDGFAVFQLYVCAAFLLHWREQLLLEQDFQGLLLLLQNLPTHNWTDAHIGVLVAEAFRLKFTYADAPKHLVGKS